MKKNNLELVKWAEDRLGWPYWYGCICYLCTEKLLVRKTKQFPSHYTKDRMPTYRSHIAQGLSCTDCSGLIKGYWWDDNGKQVYELDGRPDTSANGIYRAASTKGSIKTLPETFGALVWRDGHIGVYVGGGQAIEARGFNYGVVKTLVADRNWTNWCLCPYITYVANDSGEPVDDVALGDRTLKKGDRGTDVAALQQMLIDLKYRLPQYGVDGDFGSETDSAVRAFQRAEDLEVDGIVGEGTLAALLNASSEDAPDETDDNESDGTQLTVTGGSVYVRTGPGTQYGKVGVAHRDDKLTAIDAENWRPVLVDGAVCWISGKYVQ